MKFQAGYFLKRLGLYKWKKIPSTVLKKTFPSQVVAKSGNVRKSGVFGGIEAKKNTSEIS